MIKKPYKFIIKSPSLGEYQLKYDPDFSDDRSMIFGRDTKYHGILRQVGINIRFVKDGKALLQQLYETFGIEVYVELIIYQLNKQINDYEIFFEGKINFEVYKIEDLFVSVGVEETGILTKFKNRDDILVNLQATRSVGDVLIPEFTQETIPLGLHSKTIAKRFLGSSNKDEAESAFPDQNKERIEPAIFDLYQQKGYTRHVLFSFIEEIDEIEGLDTTGLMILEDEPAPILVVVEPGSHRFNFKMDYLIQITGSLNPGWGFQEGCGPYSSGGGAFDWIRVNIYFKLVNPDDPTRNETITVKTYEKNKCGINEFTVDDAYTYAVTKDLIPGDEISFYGKIETNSNLFRPGPGTNYDFYTDFYATQRVFNSLEVYALTLSPVPNSISNSLMLFETWARTAQLITDTPDAFRSSLYGRTDSEPFAYGVDGPASLRAITNGFQIRQFPLAEKPIFASIKDLYETCDAIDNIGVGIEEGKIVVEKKSYFYSDAIILTLNNVAEIKKSVAREYYYNEIELGYSKWENEEVNGLDEFNSKRNWTTIITVIKNKLSKLARYIASGYAIEFTRRKTYANTSTEDWKYDNDNFIISVVRDGEGFKAKTTEGYDSDYFANILDPATAYNLDLSPTRSLIKWGNVIKGSVLKYLDKAIKFSFGTANYDAESKRTDEASVIIEDQNHDPNTFENALWIPEYYEFEAPVRAPQLAAIKANPYGQIQFSSGTSNYKYGYIINVKVNTDENKGTFKLLRANR